MGTVYRVRHATLGRQFALKALRRDLVDRPRSVGALHSGGQSGRQRVASRAWSRSPTSAICRRGQPYFVMELLTGTRLSWLIKRGGPLPAARAVRIVRQVAEALRRRARRRRRASRSEAGQHPHQRGRRRSRRRQGARLRPGQGGRRQPAHARRHGVRHAALHEPRAGVGRAGRSPRRHLRARRGDVRDVHGHACRSRPTATWACSPSTCTWRRRRRASCSGGAQGARRARGRSRCVAWRRSRRTASQRWRSCSTSSIASFELRRRGRARSARVEPRRSDTAFGVLADELEAPSARSCEWRAGRRARGALAAHAGSRGGWRRAARWCSRCRPGGSVRSWRSRRRRRSPRAGRCRCRAAGRRRSRPVAGCREPEPGGRSRRVDARCRRQPPGAEPARPRSHAAPPTRPATAGRAPAPGAGSSAATQPARNRSAQALGAGEIVDPWAE